MDSNSLPNPTVTVTELKQNLGKLLQQVEEQEEVVITRNGHKIARLTPYVTDIEQYFTLREKALDYQYGGKKVSYQEFMEISEKSTLRMEFINGEIYLLGSPVVRHQQLLGRLHLIFNRFFAERERKVFFAPFDVHFFKKDIDVPDVMQPDLLVACDLAGNISEKGKYMGTPSLVLEILSSSTRNKDLVLKLNTYCQSGVKEYWVVDESQAKILVYSFQKREVEKFETSGRTETASSLVFAGLAVDVGELFANLL